MKRWRRFAMTTLSLLIGSTIYIFICIPKSTVNEISNSKRNEELPVNMKGNTISSDTTVTAPVKLVIVGQMRGGTTLVGELFNQDPRVFYWFEPLASPWDRLDDNFNGYVDNYPNGTMRFIPPDAVKEFAQIVHNILDCDFENIPASPLKHQFVLWWGKSKKTKPYSDCIDAVMRQTNSSVRGTISDKVMRQCVFHLTRACQTSPMRVVKTIRMPGYILDEFFRSVTSEKIVYYTRDPRGILVSRALLKWVNSENEKSVKKHAAVICDRFVHDTTSISNLDRGYPTSILSVKYEDLAQTPLITSRHIYGFIGRHMPASVQKWLHQNTHSATEDGSMGTRRNASATAEKWRTFSPFPEETNRIVLKECRKALKLLGYIHV